MNHFEQQYELEKQRRLDAQAQADRHRLTQRSRQPRQISRLASVYKPTLYRLGKRLELIGNQLQVRYGDLHPSPINDSNC